MEIIPVDYVWFKQTGDLNKMPCEGCAFRHYKMRDFGCILRVFRIYDAPESHKHGCSQPNQIAVHKKDMAPFVARMVADKMGGVE